MKRDRRPVAEQVRSGFVIVGKMLAAFGIAVVFLAGSTLIRTLPHTRNQVALGWLLVGLSVLVMFTTVKFWAAGFFGFVGYWAFRSLAGVLVADHYHVSRLYMVAISASAFVMFLLSIQFASKKLNTTPIDRIGIVIAASSMLLAFLMGNTYAFLCSTSEMPLCWCRGSPPEHQGTIDTTSTQHPQSLPKVM
jgi:hypothetical protein